MDCLICFKVFNKEVEYRTEPPPNPEMCMDIICKLFNILPSHPNIRRIFEDPIICRGCHGKLDVVDKVFKSAKYDISEVLAAGVRSASEIENLVRAIEIRGVEATPEMDAQIGDIEDTSEENFEQPLTSQDPKGNGIDEVVIMEVSQIVDPLEIPVAIGQTKVGTGPSQPPIVSRNGVEKEARICLKPIEITPGATGFKVHRVNQAGESGTNYAFEIREKELVNEESEPSEEESEDTHLKCRFCSKIYSSKKYLNQHLALHTGQLPFQCQHCSRQFNQRKGLRNHLGNKTSSKCVTCNKTFPTSGCLMQHDWKVHQRGRYARDQMKKNFTKLKDGRFKCNRCAKTVKAPKQHLMVHRPPKYPCPVEGCGKMFNFSHNRTNHMNINHKISYKCGVAGCGKLFRSKYYLLIHAKVHSKSKGPRVGKK